MSPHAGLLWKGLRLNFKALFHSPFIRIQNNRSVGEVLNPFTQLVTGPCCTPVAEREGGKGTSASMLEAMRDLSGITLDTYSMVILPKTWGQ